MSLFNDILSGFYEQRIQQLRCPHNQNNLYELQCAACFAGFNSQHSEKPIKKYNYPDAIESTAVEVKEVKQLENK